MSSFSIALTRALVGLAQGIALYLLYRATETGGWAPTKPLLFAGLLVPAVFVPVMVVAGMGNGNVTHEAQDALAAAARAGILVVRSTRLVSGDVARNVEVDDDALGFVASDQLNPQKSRVLLKLCPTRETSPREVQEAFYRY